MSEENKPSTSLDPNQILFELAHSNPDPGDLCECTYCGCIGARVVDRIKPETHYVYKHEETCMWGRAVKFCGLKTPIVFARNNDRHFIIGVEESKT